MPDDTDSEENGRDKQATGLPVEENESQRLKRLMSDFELSVQSLCIRLAHIQHIFSDEEFRLLAGHIQALEDMAAEKKKLIGS